MKPNFKNIDIYAGFQPKNGMEWQKANGIEANWRTPEQIQVKPVYTKRSQLENTGTDSGKTGLY